MLTLTQRKLEIRSHLSILRCKTTRIITSCESIRLNRRYAMKITPMTLTLIALRDFRTRTVRWRIKRGNNGRCASMMMLVSLDTCITSLCMKTRTAMRSTIGSTNPHDISSHVISQKIFLLPLLSPIQIQTVLFYHSSFTPTPKMRNVSKNRDPIFFLFYF